MKVEVTGDVITGYVDIKASPERVFAALADTKQWWGSPEMYRLTRSEMPLQAGADWISEGVGVDGKTFSVAGKVLVADPPRVLSHTWNPSWEDGLPETTVTYRLEPIDEGTRVHITHGSFADFTDGAKEHYQGWIKVLGWLAAFCER